MTKNGGVGAGSGGAHPTSTGLDRSPMVRRAWPRPYFHSSVAAVRLRIASGVAVARLIRASTSAAVFGRDLQVLLGGVGQERLVLRRSRHRPCAALDAIGRHLGRQPVAVADRRRQRDQRRDLPVAPRSSSGRAAAARPATPAVWRSRAGPGSPPSCRAASPASGPGSRSSWSGPSPRPRRARWRR